MKKTFYENGNIKTEIPDQNGTAIYYHKNGKIKGIISFKNGKPHGTARWYTDTGKLQYIDEIIDGKIQTIKEFK